MGYRSDVTAMFYCPENKLTFSQVMDWLRSKFPLVFKEWTSEYWAPLKSDAETSPVVFKVDGVKWYTDSDFEDVEAFEDMVQWFEYRDPASSDEECPIECEFGRTGEDTDDIEYRCSFNSQSRMNQVRKWDLT